MQITETKQRLGKKHGCASPASPGHPTYTVWRGMVSRCHCPSSGSYKDYGARGVTVCSRWVESFEAFAADMGYRPSNKHSIDRIDGTKGYEPSNCRWATDSEQANNRRGVRVFQIGGEAGTVRDWSTRTGINMKTLQARLHRGWSFEDAIGRPAMHKGAAC